MTVLAGLLGAALSFAGENPFDDERSSRPDPGEMSADQLSSFPEFPLYGLPRGFDGPAFHKARRVSSATLAKEAGGVEPVQTIGVPPNRAEDRGHRVAPDFVTLLFGDCDARGDSGCSPPLEIQIWRLCNRSLDDYEIAPGTPYPHVETEIRGTKAAEFDDRLELYAGSITIVIFAERLLATRAAEALVPLNGLATAEMGSSSAGPLPLPAPGPDCA